MIDCSCTDSESPNALYPGTDTGPAIDLSAGSLTASGETDAHHRVCMAHGHGDEVLRSWSVGPVRVDAGESLAVLDHDRHCLAEVVRLHVRLGRDA